MLNGRRGAQLSDVISALTTSASDDPPHRVNDVQVTIHKSQFTNSFWIVTL
jgi:hypothetical protein